MAAFTRLTEVYQLAVGPGTATSMAVTLPAGQCNSYRVVNPNAFHVRTRGGLIPADTVTSTTGYLILAGTAEVFSIITPGGPMMFSGLAVDSPAAPAGAGVIEVHFGTGE